MSELPSNLWPVNQAAKRWLLEVDPPDESRCYLAQLASWALDKQVVSVPRPMSPSQPLPHDLETAVNRRLGAGAQEAERASEWFLSNPNLDRQEQADNLERELEQAQSPQDAAQSLIETVYDLMVAASVTSPE